MRYLDRVEAQREVATEFGCPIGSLCQELDKSPSGLSDQVDDVVRMQLSWVCRQLDRLGHEDPAAAGLDLVTSLHGTILVANALKEPDVITQRVAGLRDWLEQI
jgi:hypothetical protein